MKFARSEVLEIVPEDAPAILSLFADAETVYVASADSEDQQDIDRAERIDREIETGMVVPDRWLDPNRDAVTYVRNGVTILRMVDSFGSVGFWVREEADLDRF